MGYSMIHVSELNIFPVKSFQGMSVQSCFVDDFGPQWDRRLMLINESGRFVTQRQLPLMSQMSASITGQVLTLTSPSSTFSLDLPSLELLDKSITVQVWNDSVHALLLTNEVNQWLSNELKTNIRLCFISSNTLRQVDLDYAKLGDKTGFSDGFPFLIMSQASLDFLSQQVGFELSSQRFRPNIVVSGCDAFEEDTWKSIVINGISFDIVKPCSRCVIPTIDPKTSIKQPEVMQVLLKHRKKDKAVYAGQNMIHRGQGQISVGDLVNVVN